MTLRLLITTVDGGHIEVETFDKDSALDFVETLKDPDGEEFLTFDLDEEGISLVARRHIVRVDLED